MQEVIGSTPIFSTLKIKVLRNFVKPFLFEVTQQKFKSEVV